MLQEQELEKIVEQRKKVKVRNGKGWVSGIVVDVDVIMNQVIVAVEGFKDRFNVQIEDIELL